MGDATRNESEIWHMKGNEEKQIKKKKKERIDVRDNESERRTVCGDYRVLYREGLLKTAVPQFFIDTARYLT